jgi:hypothetical protein
MNGRRVGGDILSAKENTDLIERNLYIFINDRSYE